jgi:hypothetical protein
MSKIFISYRREDSAPYAGRLFDRLTAHFGTEQVFIDIDNIGLGQDFVDAIHESIELCGVLVALIGPNWISCASKAGGRRLDETNDFVRLEVSTALERKIRVIPVIVGGATMPRAHELPPALAALSRRNALELSDIRFHQDIDRLIHAIEKVVGVSALVQAAVSSHKAVANIPDKSRPSKRRGLAAKATRQHIPATKQSQDRTGIEIYSVKPWSKLGKDPRCLITIANSDFAAKKGLKWDAYVFIPLEPGKRYNMAIKRPSDFLSAEANLKFSLTRGEVKRYRYEPPLLSFMAGEIVADATKQKS